MDNRRDPVSSIIHDSRLWKDTIQRIDFKSSQARTRWLLLKKMSLYNLNGLVFNSDRTLPPIHCCRQETGNRELRLNVFNITYTKSRLTKKSVIIYFSSRACPRSSSLLFTSVKPSLNKIQIQVELFEHGAWKSRAWAATPESN